MEKLKRLYAAFEDYLAGGLLFAGLMLILANVVLRYNPMWRPKAWIDEYALYLVVWGTLVGVAVALRNDHHIKVDMLYNFLPLHIKRWVSVFASVLGTAFALIFAVYGVQLVQFYAMMGQRSINTQTPEWIPALCLPLAGVMFTIRYLEKLWILLANGGQEWFRRQKQAEEEEKDIGNTSFI